MSKQEQERKREIKEKLNKDAVAMMLRGIDRYNPGNLEALECYVEVQCEKGDYDLEANLAILKLYQFNPTCYNTDVVVQILLKALNNLPHNDLVLCKSLIDPAKFDEKIIDKIMQLHDCLETCNFTKAWSLAFDDPELRGVIANVKGFEEQMRRFVVHVINITYQRIEKSVLRQLVGNLPDTQLNQVMQKNNWRDEPDGYVYIQNQEDNVKTRNINETIEFENVAPVLATYR